MHYTGGNEKSFILLLTKRDPRKAHWIQAHVARGREGPIIAEFLTIEATVGYAPSNYTAYEQIVESREDDEEDGGARDGQRGDHGDDADFRARAQNQ